ncbi:hypothetical protein NA57DRAFT_70834 [Rhizodiscina lignyota]|uniref:RBR-type E3 ubiquitin transferase n=1 Tax=Rhizodiscina lignyota TaxID=1504668 RepID=A0A9P4ISK7_9PEZI|nr:hypothetical protein NA57DRAFT_70834 [Rhizodiscina lignyota]
MARRLWGLHLPSDDLDNADKPEKNVRLKRERSSSEDLEEQVSHKKQRTDEPVGNKQCISCTETLSKQSFASSLLACDHAATVCLSCFTNWIRVRIDEGNWKAIPCPECSRTLSYGDLLDLLKEVPKLFERYDTLITRDAISSDSTFRYCLAPGCASDQFHPRGTDEPIFTCEACGFKACVVHECAWHAGETCSDFGERKEKEESAQRRRDEKASIAAVKQDSKECPNKECKVRITKYGGCDHMTCSRCKHEFCWECLARYDEIASRGNHKHRKGCSYHRPYRVPGYQPPEIP